METKLTHGIADLELALKVISEHLDACRHQSNDTDLTPNGVTELGYYLGGAVKCIEDASRFVHCCLTHDGTARKYVNQPTTAPF